MPRLRIFYVLSIGILGVLAGLAIFRPLVGGHEFSAIARESVLEEKDQWIIQFDIINQEETDMSYRMVWTTGGETYTETVLVPKGTGYSHIRHIYKETVPEYKVNMTLFREGESAPFEQVTYHLK
ncbi:MAG TPA: hypothetical protein VJK47_02415 [Dehalococcoidales bacterium]|nr:hypothetical protein [Dehalococcoidales bacterium]